MKEFIEKMKGMGYEVSVASEGYSDEGYDHEDGSRIDPQSCPTVYIISGFGIESLYLNEDDEESWKRLVHPDAHQFRLDYLRHLDADDDFELSSVELLKRNTALQVKLGDITEKEAKAQIKQAEEAEAA